MTKTNKTNIIKASALVLLLTILSVFLLGNNKNNSNNNDLVHGEKIVMSSTPPLGVVLTGPQRWIYDVKDGKCYLGTSDIDILDYAEVIGGRTVITSSSDYNTVTYLKEGVIKSVESISTGTYFDVTKIGEYQFKVTTKAGIILTYEDTHDYGVIQIYLSKVTSNNNDDDNNSGNNNNNNNNGDGGNTTTDEKISSMDTLFNFLDEKIEQFNNLDTLDKVLIGAIGLLIVILIIAFIRRFKKSKETVVYYKPKSGYYKRGRK